MRSVDGVLISLSSCGAAMSCDWEGNRRSGIALVMRHRPLFIHLRAQGLSTYGLKVVGLELVGG